MRQALTLVLGMVMTPGLAHAQEMAACQAARGGATATSQPRIVAIPFTKEGEDLRTVLEEDLNRRVAVTLVQQAFDERGFSSVDFLGALRAAETMDGWQLMSQSDIKTAILDHTRADIYVEIETEFETRSTGSRAAVVLMRGFLSANGLSLSNQVARSQWSQITESQLIEKAVESGSEPLLSMMQEKFDGFVELGVPIQVNVNVREGAANDIETWVGDFTVGDIVEEWVADNAWLNQYDLTAITPKRMFFGEVRIPMRDPETCRNYSPFNFGRELRQHLARSRIRSSVSLTNGNVFVELQ